MPRPNLEQVRVVDELERCRVDRGGLEEVRRQGELARLPLVTISAVQVRGRERVRRGAAEATRGESAEEIWKKEKSSRSRV